MNKILKYILLDILRNKIVLSYLIILSVLSWVIFSLEDNSSKAILSLLNIILLTVPLFSIIFSTIYIYNSQEFINLLLSQPVRRRKIWWSLFGGLSIAFSVAFMMGIGIPLFIFAEWGVALLILVVGVLLSIIFIAMALLSASLMKDKAKGIGLSIMIWLFFSIIFDGIVLFLLFQFADYPIEKAMLVLIAFSPTDLARILVLLQLDISAMMGYTGAIFKEFLGTAYGMVTALVLLLLWVFLPFLWSLRRFVKHDV